jgi:thymidylate synthase
MLTIYSKTVGQAWLTAVNTVIQEGSYLDQTDVHVSEVLDLFIEIEDAYSQDAIVKEYADQKMISWMVDENFGGTSPVLNWGYCYGTRLRDFNGINQISEVIEKLKSDPETRSATISLVKPEDDFKGHMPCITTLDVKIRKDVLHVTGFFRSQDIGKKLYADILALGSIQKMIAEQVGVKSGHVKIFITSAHIYEADFEDVKTFLAAAGNSILD